MGLYARNGNVSTGKIICPTRGSAQDKSCLRDIPGFRSQNGFENKMAFDEKSRGKGKRTDGRKKEETFRKTEGLISWRTLILKSIRNT